VLSENILAVSYMKIQGGRSPLASSTDAHPQDIKHLSTFYYFHRNLPSSV